MNEQDLNESVWKEHDSTVGDNPNKAEETRVKDIRKVFIKDYGNLTLEIKGSDEVGVLAYSEKRSEELFIPWTSIIFISKIYEVKEHGA